MRLVFGELFESHAVDLAGGVQQHLVEDDDFLGALCSRRAFARRRSTGRRRPPGSFAKGDVGPHVFAVDQIVDADDSSQLDGRVLFQGFLDLLGQMFEPS